VYFRDADGDGFGDAEIPWLACGPAPGYVLDATDCDDSDAGVWGTPSEALGVRFLDGVSVAWDPPVSPGGVSVTYDLLRSDAAADFISAICVATKEVGTTTTDLAAPPSRRPYFYLVRAENGGAAGLGSLGTGSAGTPRAGRTCP
jgi:hypothetical protein